MARAKTSTHGSTGRRNSGALKKKMGRHRGQPPTGSTSLRALTPKACTARRCVRIPSRAIQLAWHRSSLTSPSTERTYLRLLGESFGAHVKPINVDTHREQKLLSRYPIVHSCSKDTRWLVRENRARITHTHTVFSPVMMTVGVHGKRSIPTPE